jgi:hypothetical protein
MEKHLRFNIGLVGMAAIMMVGTTASAADRAAAAADLAEIATISVQSKGNLAGDALGGDVDAIAESSKRSDAVDAAVAEGQQAHSAIERAATGGDPDAADSAAEDLKAALQKAKDALNGVIPEVKGDKHAEWKESQTNTGSGPGRAYDPPNIYNKPWQTQGMQSFYQGLLWGNFWASGRGTGDRDATPE